MMALSVAAMAVVFSIAASVVLARATPVNS